MAQKEAAMKSKVADMRKQVAGPERHQFSPEIYRRTKHLHGLGDIDWGNMTADQFTWHGRSDLPDVVWHNDKLFVVTANQRLTMLMMSQGMTRSKIYEVTCNVHSCEDTYILSA